MSKQPNFVFFITDQQRADWLGCYGHPVVKTPNIDAIAASGTRFTNFHTASPVCMPNRASLMTGRYPSVHGLRYNGGSLSSDANTFVDVLAAGGYNTAMIGKSHLRPFLDFPAVRPEDTTFRHYSEAWKSEENRVGPEHPDNYEADVRYEVPTPFYGFKHVDMVTGHGDQCGGHYQQWFRQQAADYRELLNRDNQLSHNYSCPQAYRTPIPEELYSTAYIGKQAREYIQQQESSKQPFFLFISFPDPHHPFNPPGRYWDMYRPEQFECSLPFESHKNPTPPMTYMHDQWQKSTSAQALATTGMMTDQDNITQVMALTAGMIGMIDDTVGSVVDELKANDLYDNSVLSFTTDHGDYLGDFNMLLKGSLPFRSITRVPMIWSDPESRQASTSAALGSTVDISATILERAGLAAYRGLQGRSFMACMNNSASLNENLLVEYNDGVARLGFEQPARVRSLITDSYRLTIYKNQPWGELYDLVNDPNETYNRWLDDSYSATKTDLLLKLNQRLFDLMDESPQSLYLA